MVAEQRGDKVICLNKEYAPFELFNGGTLDEVSFWDFVTFLDDRVFQEDRVDKDELLEEMGLEYYDSIDITKQTKAALPMQDYYTVEWIE